MKISRCPIHISAQKEGSALALATKHTSFTYDELDHVVQKHALFLQEHGIKKRMRVAFVARADFTTILHLFALLRLGSVACPINFRLPKEAQQEAIKKTEAHYLLSPSPIKVSDSTLYLDDVATMLTTSGSSAAPKVACHSFDNHLKSAQFSNEIIPLKLGDSWLFSLPPFHVSGIAILFRVFCATAMVRILNEAEPPYGFSHVSLVPAQARELFQNPQFDPKYILLGGGPIPTNLQKRNNVFATYGMTEMSSQIYTGEKRLGDTEIKLKSDGEICVKGSTLFLGYFNGSKTLEKSVDEEAFFPTNDIGKWDDSGTLHIVGRKDRQFISGGENIQPEEIENVIMRTPGVADVAIVPVDDPKYGKRGVAFLEPFELHRSIDLHDKLPKYKHPVAYLPMPKKMCGLKKRFAELKNLAKLHLDAPAENQELELTPLS